MWRARVDITSFFSLLAAASNGFVSASAALRLTPFNPEGNIGVVIAIEFVELTSIDGEGKRV